MRQALYNSLRLLEAQHQIAVVRSKLLNVALLSLNYLLSTAKKVAMEAFYIYWGMAVRWKASCKGLALLVEVYGDRIISA